MPTQFTDPQPPTLAPPATEVSDERVHAQIVADELAALLLPLRPVAVSINRFGTGFQRRLGVELPMPTVVDDLTTVRALIGGTLVVSAETTLGGSPYLRHTLTGRRAGVPFEVWTTVHPAPRLVVAA